MEFKEVKIILDRIKCNYPSFQNDDFTKKEWYKELKEYKLKDVIEKLEKHFRSEEFGMQIPKVYFLTKYLKKENDAPENIGLKIKCPFCEEWLLLDDQPKHYERCSSVDYINRISVKIRNKEIDKNKYKNLSEKEFDEEYEKILSLLKVKKINSLGIKRMNEVL